MENNSKFERKLGFNAIRNSIKNFCLCNGGRNLVDAMCFMTDYIQVEYNLELTEEFCSIFLTNRIFPDKNYFDLREEFVRLKIEGTFIDKVSLFDFQRSLHTIFSCVTFLHKNQEVFVNLYALTNEIQNAFIGDKFIIPVLHRCDKLLDNEGEFSDSASPELQKIRITRRNKIKEINKRMLRLLSDARREGWTNNESELTFRNGRQVIPVSATHKKRIRGFVIDQSASGNTFYIEPAEVFELNNEVRELELQEEREIINILTEFTDEIRPFIPFLTDAYAFLSQIDFIRAKALYAIHIKAGKPIIEKEPKIYWFEARHPLLEASLKHQNKSIVPLKIELNSKQRILIISGPNAGGKSVCLKTVGLLQYMLQCGMLVPMKETSESGVFSNIFIDIGDEQSLEDDLSTYSSHLLNMKTLCETADERTLFLIDECGSGTDPQVGGSIAEAIIEDLNSKQAFGVVTTHYSNLKLLADYPENKNSIVNGAMLFDRNNMKPLYILTIGKPGSSFAFEIARNIGLPDRIISNALKKTGKGMSDYEEQLQQLEEENNKLQKQKAEFHIADTLLASTIEKYEKLLADISTQKKTIINEAKQKAEQIIADSNRKIENVISEIRRINAEKEQTKQIRTELNKELSKIRTEINTENIKKDNKSKAESNNLTACSNYLSDASPIMSGDSVVVLSVNKTAQVTKVSKNKLQVALDNMVMTLPITDVKKIKQKNSNAVVKTKPAGNNRGIIAELDKKRASYHYQIDLRGEKAEQALAMVAKQIDDTRLLGEREFSILHGTGNGILKTVIREYLKTSVDVESFRIAPLEFGGEGITLVTVR